MKIFRYRYFLFPVFFFLLSSCSDDMKINYEETEDGWLQINMRVAQPEIISTRGDENSVNSIAVLFYDEGELIGKYQPNIISVSQDGVINTKFRADAALSGLSDDAVIYIIANKQITENLNQEHFEKQTFDEINLESLVMSWKGTKKEISGNQIGTSSEPISLSRSVAKISVLNSEPEFELKGFELVNTAKEGYVIAAQLENQYITVLKEQNVFSDSMEPVFSFPTQAGQSYVLIHGEWEGKDSWYKIRFKTGESELSLKPNHWYKLQINSVKGLGHESDKNSESWPFSDDEIEYAIIDQTESVLSMISDGFRELGTTRSIVIEGAGNNISGNVFDVKMSCIEELSLPSSIDITCHHYPEFTTDGLSRKTHKIGESYEVEIIEGAGWLEIDKVEEVSIEAENSSEQSLSSGKLFRYTLKFSSHVPGGEMRGLIRVTWQGLSREIPVIYLTEGDHSNIVNYDVMILHQGEDLFVIEDYMDFIDEGKYCNYRTRINGVESSQDIGVSLKGVYQGDMTGGKTRDEGFHFPVMYGNTDNPCWTEHQMSIFSELINGYSYFSVDIKSDRPEVWDDDKLIFLTGKDYAKIDRNDFVTNIIEEKVVRRREKTKILSNVNSDLVLTLKRANIEADGSFTGIKDDYDYSVANLIVTLYKDENDSEGIDFSINLYHTGLFHFVEDDNIANRGIFYYYEVFPMGRNIHGKKLYWLDRNLGATSALDYIDFSGDGSYGEKNSGGMYYKIAETQSGTIKILNSEVCPPGWHIPNVTEWNCLLEDPNFISKEEFWGNNNYFSTFYQSSEGEVYFPKGRLAHPFDKYSGYEFLWYGEATIGESATGYYWTSSTTEDGKSLGAYRFSGKDLELIKGDFEKDFMYVRCVAGDTPLNESISQINLKVKGATHVYLYTLNAKGEKQGLYPYPGKEIANAKTVRNLDFSKKEEFETDNSCIDFSYYGTIPEQDLHVLFVYKDENGKVSLLSANRSASLKDAEGWTVENGMKYYFYWDEDFLNWDFKAGK